MVIQEVHCVILSTELYSSFTLYSHSIAFSLIHLSEDADLVIKAIIALNVLQCLAVRMVTAIDRWTAIASVAGQAYSVAFVSNT